jgi:hypothetical protein
MLAYLYFNISFIGGETEGEKLYMLQNQSVTILSSLLCTNTPNTFVHDVYQVIVLAQCYTTRKLN